MTEIKLDPDKHDIHDLIRYLEGDHHMSVYDRQQVANALRKQVKDTEPPFGSVVRAPWSDKSLLWVCLWRGWQSETGVVTDWSQLRNPQILRVGIG